MKKRVFFAIDLPKEAKEVLADFFKNTARIGEVKWERPEKLHLTLVFLGFVDEKKIPALTLVLHSAVVNHRKFSLRIIPQVLAFPTLSNPRVLWLSIEDDIGLLQKITKKLTKMLKDKNFRFDEREFSAHLTIGRFRGGVKKWQKQEALKTIAKTLPKGSIAFPVEGITLFESKLTPKGSVYKIVAYGRFEE